MWVFGYGSLMFDGWENNFDCAQRAVAELRGYRRAFNKASVSNWGTHECPCPTLNLVLDAGATCIGVAFEFSEAQRADVEAYLARREGKNFKLSYVEVITKDRGSAQALVPLYSGKNLIRTSDTRAILQSVQRAQGSSGKCFDYVMDVYEQLAKLGINDPAVTEMREQLGNALPNSESPLL